MSYDRKRDAASRGPFDEAFHALDVLSSAARKFCILEATKQQAENLSDLDILDFEQSTATALYKDLDFPRNEFDLVQKTSYRLLTYIMGMLEMFSQIFPSRSHTLVTGKELEMLWKKRKMAIRTTWIEKQLVGWEKIEGLVPHCRDWHKARQSLRAKQFRL
jgi:hypothetical protein